MPTLMPPTDAMFLVPETREQPMHVGGLQLFRTPDGADRDYLRSMYEKVLATTEVAALFRRRPHRSLTTLGQWTWVVDDDIDLEHHVRHSALPRPGRVRELLALTSRLHGTLLDRSRPLWEAHLIEGLEGGRFAVYTKLHHAMMDGVSALRLMQRSLSVDPDDRDTPVPWTPRAQRRGSSRGDADGDGGLLSLPGAALHTALDVAGLGPAVLRVAARTLREQALTLPLQAPRTIFNVGISGSRRYAAQSWPLDQVRGVSKAAGTTVNDVVLAMCAGALREYLLELDALPDAPLVAMTPVSLRSGEDGSETGNAVGTILCNLHTHVADPVERLAGVHASMRQGKEVLRGLSQLQATALSAVVMAPLVLNSLVAVNRVAPPPFNLVISNIPGPDRPLYWNGAEMLGSYPLSIPTNGQALNITATSYNGSLDFGLTGCRRSAPHLQRLLTHLDDALDDLTARLVG